MRREKTIEEYNKQQAIRAWNARFRVPPVFTNRWTKEDWKKWNESRLPLPPFEEWKESKI